MHIRAIFLIAAATWVVAMPFPAEAQSGWEELRQCENGGSYTSDAGDTYRGAYQFLPSTWESVGGSGDPADASPAEQDMRAQMLYEQSDPATQWPECSRYLDGSPVEGTSEVVPASESPNEETASVVAPPATPYVGTPRTTG